MIESAGCLIKESKGVPSLLGWIMFVAAPIYLIVMAIDKARESSGKESVLGEKVKFTKVLSVLAAFFIG
ncbi:MAG TPA: hypothetical protein PKN93_19850 [Leptospiraceae bacterium]|nr:hypothetical protein [Leptospiraceae bacterium]